MSLKYACVTLIHNSKTAATFFVTVVVFAKARSTDVGFHKQRGLGEGGGWRGGEGKRKEEQSEKEVRRHRERGEERQMEQ